MRALIAKFVDVRDDNELRGLLWSIAYGFLIMSSYYILRAVRDEIGAADSRNLQLLWTAVFFVMLAAVPLYSWMASKWSRGVFVPLANRFFIACLVLFWLSLVLLPDAALSPDPDSRDLYFVARGDGTHEFSRTLEAHLRAKAALDRARRRRS